MKSQWARKISTLEREWKQRLPKAEIVFVSFPKSGRTWLRAMISRLYQRRFDLPADMLISHDNMHKLNPLVPIAFFTHDVDPMGSVESLRRERHVYDGKKVVFLMRHPCDVAVSHFFQMKYRKIGRRTGAAEGFTIYDFVMRPGHGLELIIEYTNLWHRYIAGRRDALLIKYEDMKFDPHEALDQLCAFLGTDFSHADISEALVFCSFENLQKRERDSFYANSALRPADRSNPDSFKVRRGKVGGYKDYFTMEQLIVIDALLQERLDANIEFSGDINLQKADSKGNAK